MKCNFLHITLPAFLALAMALTACHKDETRAASSATGSEDAPQPFATAGQADSIARLQGYLTGVDFAGQKATIVAADPSFNYDNEAFLRGFNVALNGHSPAYTQGIKASLEILTKINDMQNYGVEVNKKQLLDAIESTLMADSISEENGAKLTSAYNDLLQRLYKSGGK